MTSETPKTLHFGKITRFAQHGQVWYVDVSPDTTLEDLLRPTYWSHVSGSTFNGRYNEVVVQWEDNSKLARLFVRQYEKTWARMELLEFHEFEKSEAVIVPEAYEVSWQGPQEKYRIVRKEDGLLIRNNFTEKQHAVDYIHSTLKQ